MSKSITWHRDGPGRWFARKDGIVVARARRRHSNSGYALAWYVTGVPGRKYADTLGEFKAAVAEYQARREASSHDHSE